MKASSTRESELWYLEIGGSRLGPYTVEQLRDLFAKDELNATDIVRSAASGSIAMTLQDLLNAPAAPASLPLPGVPQRTAQLEARLSQLVSPPSPDSVPSLQDPRPAYDLLNTLQSAKDRKNRADHPLSTLAPSAPTRNKSYHQIFLGGSVLVAAFTLWGSWALLKAITTPSAPVETASSDASPAATTVQTVQTVKSTTAGAQTPTATTAASNSQAQVAAKTAAPAAATAPVSAKPAHLAQKTTVTTIATSTSDREASRDHDRDREASRDLAEAPSTGETSRMKRLREMRENGGKPMDQDQRDARHEDRRDERDEYSTQDAARRVPAQGAEHDPTRLPANSPEGEAPREFDGSQTTQP